MIGHHDHLLGISQVNAGDRVAQRQRLTQPSQPGPVQVITLSRALRLRSPRETPRRSDIDALLFLRVGSEP